jgi:hypothetical protein
MWLLTDAKLRATAGKYNLQTRTIDANSVALKVETSAQVLVAKFMKYSIVYGCNNFYTDSVS